MSDGQNGQKHVFTTTVDGDTPIGVVEAKVFKIYHDRVEVWYATGWAIEAMSLPVNGPDCAAAEG